MTKPIKPILNVREIEWQTQKHGDAFEARMGAIASRIGAVKLGYRLTVVPPGKKAWPLHAHYANEEMFFVLEGSGRLRYGDREYPIAAGDFVAAPPGGPAVAHQIVNDSTSELRYLCVSTMDEPDVCTYPESGKFNVMVGAAPGGAEDARTFSHVGRTSDGVDYWLGEDE